MSFTVFTEVLQNPHFQGVEDVTPDQVLKAQDSIAIVDVRENDEWVGELGHIEKAKLMNLGHVPEQYTSLPKDKTVVFVCRSGGRSAKATAFLKQQGFTHVYNMLGGMLSWNQKGLPVSKN